MKYQDFKSLTHTLLQTQTEVEEVAMASHLAQFYQKLLSKFAAPQSYSSTEATTLNGGIALSSQHALDCLQDPLRTVRFIKGTYQAIVEVQELFKNEPIQLVYAGCGPGAPIILPLLCLFTPKELNITLIDINESSMNSIKPTIESLGANDFIYEYFLGDAITYKFPKERTLHIVLSETMDKGLTQEPQVAITQNLAPQLHANGILIPESIDIYTEHTFYSKEPYFDIYKNVLELGDTYDTVDKKFLFSIHKHILSHPVFEFISDPISISEDFSETPDIAVFAAIKIYKEIQLLKSKSLISNPYCVQSLYNVSSKTYQLKYTASGIPTWQLL